MDRIIPARITPEIFQEFAWFDMLRQQKRYRAPAAFTLVMAAFAGVCFFMNGRVSSAALLGGVLLGVGLVLPLGWLLSFHFSVRAEAKKLDLAKAPVAYTLELSGKGLTVSTERERADFPWEGFHRVCRLRRCICLYAAPRRAFLLPTGTQEEGDKLWSQLSKWLPEENVGDFRR